MKKVLAGLLRKAERHQGWTKNSPDPWEPIVAEVSVEFALPEQDIHACKIQLSSARKSLWQGKLHRSPIPVLFVAADHACDDATFDRLSVSVIERFSPPTHWADACIVISSGQVVGCIEREGVGLSDWLLGARAALLSETCNPVADQLPLGPRIDARLGTPDQFIRKLELGDGNKRVKLLSELFGLERSQVLQSSATAPANAAKGRWEGADVDPDIRYRAAVVASKDWEWGNASLEIMRRMDPPDLSIGIAILYAKSSENGTWDRVRVFVNKNHDDLESVRETLRRGKLTDVVVVEPVDVVRQAARGEDGRQLRIRDSDAGSIRYEASRPKQRVHDAITNWLVAWGQQEGRVIEEGDEEGGLFDALVKDFYTDSDLLVEVKSTAELGVIRLAVGQLIDYGRVLKKSGQNTSGTVLIPPTEKLLDGQKELLKLCGFSWATLIHERDGNQVRIVLEVHQPDGLVLRVPD